MYIVDEDKSMFRNKRRKLPYRSTWGYGSIQRNVENKYVLQHSKNYLNQHLIHAKPPYFFFFPHKDSNLTIPNFGRGFPGGETKQLENKKNDVSQERKYG